MWAGNFSSPWSESLLCNITAVLHVLFNEQSNSVVLDNTINFIVYHSIHGIDCAVNGNPTII